MKRSAMREAGSATRPSDPQLLARLRAVLTERTGLNFPPERWNNIERAIAALGKEQGFTDNNAWLQSFLTESPTLNHLQELVSHLTIGETYFFRDQGLFTSLQETILPALIQQRRDMGRHLRIWSAGCSTGEEPYSIAMLLKRLLPDRQHWNITLLGTDINPHSLAKAVGGVYGNWSFRAGLPTAADIDFERTLTGSYAVAADVKAMVRFTQLNLADAIYPTAIDFRGLDIILCRNVLMYLEPACVRAIIQRFCDCLLEGGWLILSAVEATLVDIPRFTAIRMHDSIFFQKNWSAANAPSGDVRFLAAATPDIFRFSQPKVVEQIIEKTFAGADAMQNKKSSAAPQKPAAPQQKAQTPRIAAAPIISAAESLIEQARGHADGGRLAAALEYCQQAIAIDKLNPNWTELLASILLESGDTVAAEAALRRTLYLDQDRALTHVKLGNLLLRQTTRYGDAQRHFRIALEVLQEALADDVLPETDGMTVAQLREMINATVAYERPA